MKKSLLLSVKPKYVADILNGKKTIEVRKVVPKCDLPIDVYIYCTKDKEFCFFDIFASKGGYKPLYYLDNREHDDWSEKLNGKVVAKFTLRKVEHFEYDTCSRDICGYWLDNGQVFNIKKTCITSDEMFAYIGGKDGYAWHIEDLVIFDEPKELSEFRVYRDSYGKVNNKAKETYKDTLTRSPQSYCFVESEE